MKTFHLSSVYTVAPDLPGRDNSNGTRKYLLIGAIIAGRRTISEEHPEHPGKPLVYISSFNDAGHNSTRTATYSLALSTQGTDMSTHHFARLIPRVHHRRLRQDAADPRVDVRPVVPAVVDVVELPDQVQLESPVVDSLAPDLGCQLVWGWPVMLNLH